MPNDPWKYHASDKDFILRRYKAEVALIAALAAAVGFLLGLWAG